MNAFQLDLSLAKKEEQTEAVGEDKCGFRGGNSDGDCDGDQAAVLEHIAGCVASDVFWQQEASEDIGSVEPWEEEFRQIREEEAANYEQDYETASQFVKRSSKSRGSY